jgi:hypothetical protein
MALPVTREIIQELVRRGWSANDTAGVQQLLLHMPPGAYGLQPGPADPTHAVLGGKVRMKEPISAKKLVESLEEPTTGCSEAHVEFSPRELAATFTVRFKNLSHGQPRDQTVDQKRDRDRDLPRPMKRVAAARKFPVAINNVMDRVAVSPEVRAVAKCIQKYLVNYSTTQPNVEFKVTPADDDGRVEISVTRVDRISLFYLGELLAAQPAIADMVFKQFTVDDPGEPLPPPPSGVQTYAYEIVFVVDSRAARGAPHRTLANLFGLWPGSQ